MKRPRTEADLIEFALEHASSDPDAAEDVLEYFCDVVERGEVPGNGVLEYLAARFRRILAGEKPSDAMGLTRTKGQRRRRTLERIGDEHLALTLDVVRYMRGGDAKPDAIERVVSERGASTATVKRAYAAYRRLATVLLTK
jgi:hypothetical protein